MLSPLQISSNLIFTVTVEMDIIIVITVRLKDINRCDMRGPHPQGTHPPT